MGEITGFVAPGFERVRDELAVLAEADPTYSAQLAVHHAGELVVDLVAGTLLTADSLLPVFSASKGTIGITAALLLDRGQLDLDARVAAYWPEFAAAGKGDVTVRQLLSHQAGLPGVDGGYTYAELFGHDALAARLAAQRPFWQPGRAFLYHALTIGTLADELVRRITGTSLGEFFATEVPGLDLFLGTPEAEDHRVEVLDFCTAEELAAFPLPERLFDPSTWGAVAGTSDGVPLWVKCNEVDWRRAAAPAVTGFGTARGLAGTYAALRRGLLSPDALAQVAQLQVSGVPLNAEYEQRFAVPFMRPTATIPFGSWQAYGHDGAAGALAFDDPFWDLQVGYVCKRLPLPGGADRRALALVKTLQECAQAR